MKGKNKNKIKKRQQDEDQELNEQDAEDSESESKEEAEDEEEMSESRKADDLTSDDLEKSLQQLEEIASSGDAAARKEQLLQKALKDTLHKSEQDELFELLGGKSQDNTSLSTEIVKGFQENDTVVQALDVSEYLQEQHAELTKSLEMLADEMEKSSNAQHQFNLVLAKAVSETGRLVKSMAERLGVIEQQPARAPKAMLSGAQAIEKGFAGQPPAGEQLSKSDILDALEDMLRKSVEAGRGGVSENGVDLSIAASKFEQFNQISPSLLAQVRSHLRQKTAN